MGLGIGFGGGTRGSSTKVIPASFDFTNIGAGYADSVWEIKYDHDLAAANVTLPSGVTLLFNGGSITNYGTLDGNGATIVANKVQIFDTSGTISSFDFDVAYPEWFGTNGSAIEYCNNLGPGVIYLTGGTTYTTLGADLYNRCEIIADGATIIADASISGAMLTFWASGSSIKGGIIDGNSAASGTRCIQVECDDCGIYCDTIQNATTDGIWVNDNNPAYGIGDGLIVSGVKIVNPGRHGIILIADTVTYRDRVKIENVYLTKSSNTDRGILLSYVNHLTVDSVILDNGFLVSIEIGRVKSGVVSNCRLVDVVPSLASSEHLDITYSDHVTVSGNFFSGKKSSINPSNNSNKFSVVGNWFENCGSGVTCFENTGDSFITNNKFYEVEFPVSLSNVSQAIVDGNYFFECKAPVIAGATNADSKVNYENLNLFVRNNVVKLTGTYVLDVTMSLDAASFDYIEFSGNTVEGLHEIATTKSWWASYTPTTNTNGLSLAGRSGKYLTRAVIKDNVFVQNTAWSSGTAGGGCQFLFQPTYVTQLIIERNYISENFSRAIYLASETITELTTDQYVDSAIIDLSAGSAYSVSGFPALGAGDVVGAEIMYTEASSSDTGIDIVVKDGITGTTKLTYTTEVSISAGITKYKLATNQTLSKGRNLAIDCARNKTGAGNVFVRAYYLTKNN